MTNKEFYKWLFLFIYGLKMRDLSDEDNLSAQTAGLTSDELPEELKDKCLCRSFRNGSFSGTDSIVTIYFIARLYLIRRIFTISLSATVFEGAWHVWITCPLLLSIVATS